jgi:hypothetical protein
MWFLAGGITEGDWCDGKFKGKLFTSYPEGGAAGWDSEEREDVSYS